ncbi:MAG TPA: hypothetical protein VMF69_10770 [Gemmataceae bacterium]|nr:hypothetical protein [Gemmataceae bacterium]
MSEKAQQDVCSDVMADEAGDTYYIEGELDAMGHLTACNKCGRKILVEMALIGVPHHVGVTAICGECLVLPEQFRKEHPKIAAKIEGWLRDMQENKQD